MSARSPARHTIAPSFAKRVPTETPEKSRAKKFLRGSDFDYSKSSSEDEGGEALHSDYECCICLAPAFEPVQHESCGQMFCQECVANLEKCPNCRATLETKPVTLKLVLNKLNVLTVVCPSCKKDVLRRELGEHVKDCPVPCELCGASYKPREKAAHDDLKCPCSIVQCSASSVLCPWVGCAKIVD